jgi:hypothetical protein
MQGMEDLSPIKLLKMELGVPKTALALANS